MFGYSSEHTFRANSGIINVSCTVFFSILYFIGISFQRTNIIIIAASTAEMTAMPTVPNSHFFALSLAVM